MPPKQNLILDTCDMECPMPLANTKKTLAGMQQGDILKVITIDPSMEMDIRVLIKKNAYHLLCSGKEGEKFWYQIQV